MWTAGECGPEGALSQDALSLVARIEHQRQPGLACEVARHFAAVECREIDVFSGVYRAVALIRRAEQFLCEREEKTR